MFLLIPGNACELWPGCLIDRSLRDPQHVILLRALRLLLCTSAHAVRSLGVAALEMEARVDRVLEAIAVLWPLGVVAFAVRHPDLFRLPSTSWRPYLPCSSMCLPTALLLPARSCDLGPW